MADEFIAKTASENIPVWKQIVERVKTWLAGKGIGKLSDEETARAIMRALKSGQTAAEFSPRLLDIGRSNADFGWRQNDGSDSALENGETVSRYNLTKKPLKRLSAKPTVAGGALLKSYGGPGGGHHIPAKSAFVGEPRYSPNLAPAIPNAELDRLGVDHRLASALQQKLYRQFAKTGKTLTWNDAERIETKALVHGGMARELAGPTARNAIRKLKKSGVTGPTRTPWGK